MVYIKVVVQLNWFLLLLNFIRLLIVFFVELKQKYQWLEYILMYTETTDLSLEVFFCFVLFPYFKDYK